MEKRSYQVERFFSSACVGHGARVILAAGNAVLSEREMPDCFMGWQAKVAMRRWWIGVVTFSDSWTTIWSFQLGDEN